MKLIGFFLIAGLACAQEIKPDTVIGTVNGRKITADEARQLTTGIRPEAQQLLARDPGAALSALYALKHLSELAQKDGLQDQSPLKEQIANTIVEILARAEIQYKSNNSQPSPDEAEKYYNENASQFQQASLRVIYISFAAESAPQAAGVKKSLTEPEAKAKAEKLVKQVRAGADFAKLAAEHSEDETSAKKGGDFGTMKATDSVPPDVLKAVFALKENEISEPLKQSNGFYIFRIEKKTKLPYPEVREKIFNDLRQQKFDKWYKAIQKQWEVKLDKPEFFSNPAPAAPPKPVK